MKRLIPIALFFISCVLHAAKLTTPSYEIDVGSCSEGDVSCSNVSVAVKNLNSGAVAHYQGETMHSLCKDGVTPCQFLGYQFSTTASHFTLYVNGTLKVNYASGQGCLFESGQWTY